MANGGARPGAGRKPKPVELSYFEAVKEGAPYSEVVKAVRAVLKRAQKTGDPKALSAVLVRLVPALMSVEQNVSGSVNIHNWQERYTPEQVEKIDAAAREIAGEAREAAK